jgi:NAD(P)-dependent dehydrogenase (short-subunit alcohol dehydrogenase family)
VWKQLAGMDLMQRIEAINRHSTEPYEQAEKCLNTNYHGIKAVTKALLPLLQSSSHGRIVNLSSYYGLLRVKWPTHISIILSCKRKRKIVHNIAYIYQ